MMNEQTKELNIFTIPQEEVMRAYSELQNYLFREEEKEEITHKVGSFVTKYLKSFLVIGYPVREQGYLTVMPMHGFEQKEKGDLKIATITWDLEEQELMGMDFVRIEKIHVHFCEEGINHPKTRLKLLF